MSAESSYTGRYAPSPTGAQHLGNIRTALLAWLHARFNDGRFLLRIDDLDQPRVVAGSTDLIVRDLQWLGLDWDGEVMQQSSRIERYQNIFHTLHEAGHLYPCFCSRKDIQQAVSAPHGAIAVYPGTCRNLTQQSIAQRSRKRQPAWRFRVPGKTITFHDGILGPLSENLPLHCGDFIVKRADGLFAYQLAVVVDDMDQGITDVIRGADLQQSTARQILLYQTLGARVPQFWHAPLMLDKDHLRLSKRDGSDSVQQWRDSGKTAGQLIAHLLHGLGVWSSLEPIAAPAVLQQLSLSDLMTALRGGPAAPII